ncbi:ABC transporter ATP-binding protein [Amnibacterium flavum]|uniref:ABC transporter ATP-binding protein n=1 Tax=Amnibacterium flavum TaxID=2173173 RepID=A0A2V1HYI2_9MICO|nr:ABC transporter ATP-binding protein [Amnibacterium flavum]PVZ95564.1 ABC transporter ATP-binding protein [Amnibacterium flavum]
MTALLKVDDLRVEFLTDTGSPARAVRGVDFEVGEGRTLAILGESGSGKSVTSKAILGLVDFPGIVSGSIRFEGRELVGARESELRGVRGTGIGMVFQDSLDSLNPVYTVGAQLIEALRVRMGLGHSAARARALELMAEVGIVDPERRIDNYPHQFSGGMRQRICIALAVALKPRLLIADEPTTALDVTVQAGILRLLRRLQDETGMAMIFVTHDLAVAGQIASDVIVMYEGEVVERGVIEEVFERPSHAYTRGLLAAHPGAVTDWRDLRPVAGDPMLSREEAIADGF